MRITVVTVCFNAADTIEETIKSVIGQSHNDLEYIIIDGNSSDKTMDIVRKYADRISKIISEPDNGIYDAMNKGIDLATGDYINFMNAGDTFTNIDTVKDIVSLLDTSSDIIYGDSTMVDYNGRHVFSPAESDISILAKKPIYRHNASFTRTSLHKKYKFDLSRKVDYKYALDYNNIFTLWHNNAKFQKLDVNVVTWDKRGTSDKHLENIKLMFAISHQFRKPNLKERVIYVYDYIKAIRRDILRKTLYL